MEKTSEELRLELLGTTCRCGAAKKAGHTFCNADYCRLPGRLAIKLYRRMGEGYEEAYRAAAKWLDEAPDRGTQPAPELEPGRPPAFYDIPMGTGISHCRGCRATIHWIRTPKGKNMPVNPDGTSHFTTCPRAAKFSGKGKKP